jgi:hypothetical protein
MSVVSTKEALGFRVVRTAYPGSTSCRGHQVQASGNSAGGSNGGGKSGGGGSNGGGKSSR